MSAGSEGELALHERMAAASGGAALTALAVTPFDVVKTRMQLAAEAPRGVGAMATCPSCGVFVLNNGLMEHVLEKKECSNVFPRGRVEAAPSTLRSMTLVARAEGVRGLYAGLGPTLIMAVPNTALYFTAYDELRSMGPDHWSAPIICGASARLLAATAVAPFELARTQLQALSGANRSGYFSVLRDSVRQRGLGTLWRGLAPTLWRDVPFSGLYWAGFESFRRVLTPTWYRTAEDPSLSALRSAVAGLGAGALAALLTTPADVAKTRLQVAAYDVPGSSVPRSSTGALLASIARTEGPAALLAGAGPRLLKVAPACAIMIGSYEYAKALFRPPR